MLALFTEVYVYHWATLLRKVDLKRHRQLRNCNEKFVRKCEYVKQVFLCLLLITSIQEISLVSFNLNLNFNLGRMRFSVTIQNELSYENWKVFVRSFASVFAGEHSGDGHTRDDCLQFCTELQSWVSNLITC